MINKILGGFSKSDTKIMRKPLLSKFFFNFFHFFAFLSKIQLVSVHSCCACKKKNANPKAGVNPEIFVFFAFLFNLRSLSPRNANNKKRPCAQH